MEINIPIVGALSIPVEQVVKDEQVAELGYHCIGNIEKVYPTLPTEVLNDYYRIWIWENEQGHRIAINDSGNSWCRYVCEGTEEVIIAVHKREMEIQEELSNCHSMSHCTCGHEPTQDEWTLANEHGVIVSCINCREENELKAFEVTYDVAGRSGFREVVLAEDENQLEQALSEKVADYKLDSPYSKILRRREMSLSYVKLKDLSVTEYLKIKNL